MDPGQGISDLRGSGSRSGFRYPGLLYICENTQVWIYAGLKFRYLGPKFFTNPNIYEPESLCLRKSVPNSNLFTILTSNHKKIFSKKILDVLNIWKLFRKIFSGDNQISENIFFSKNHFLGKYFTYKKYVMLNRTDPKYHRIGNRSQILIRMRFLFWKLYLEHLRLGKSTCSHYEFLTMILIHHPWFVFCINKSRFHYRC